jgi:hypothetical protein
MQSKVSLNSNHRPEPITDQTPIDHFKPMIPDLFTKAFLMASYPTPYLFAYTVAELFRKSLTGLSRRLGWLYPHVGTLR